MKIQKTNIKDLLILEPKVFNDDRGYFYESYNDNVLKDHNLSFDFVQDNQSCSRYGTIRGLHFQKSKFAQTKLIRVLRGRILDVVVDLRIDSKTFGKTFSLELTSENHLQLLVPKGFAHGFSVLSEETVIIYKCDNFYHKDAESGIIYNDPDLNIDWQIPLNKCILSEKDLKLQSFKNYRDNPCF